MPTIKPIYLNSSNLLTLAHLTNDSSNLYVNNATVVWTLYDLAMEQIATGSLTSTDEDGDYEGTVPGSGLTVGQHYVIVAVVNNGAKTFYLNCVCVEDDGEHDDCDEDC